MKRLAILAAALGLGITAAGAADLPTLPLKAQALQRVNCTLTISNHLLNTLNFVSRLIMVEPCVLNVIEKLRIGEWPQGRLVYNMINYRFLIPV